MKTEGAELIRSYFFKGEQRMSEKDVSALWRKIIVTVRSLGRNDIYTSEYQRLNSFPKYKLN